MGDADRGRLLMANEEAQRFMEYAREKLETVLDGLESGVEILGDAQLALMALHMAYGSAATITLAPADVVEEMDRLEPVCVCPPDLVRRGGFRSGCPVHHD